MSLRRWPKFKGKLETTQYWFIAGNGVLTQRCTLSYIHIENKTVNFSLNMFMLFFHCLFSDTVSRSGMFCAIATTIDRCKTEGVVDVFQVVKALRIHKPGAVLNVVS